MKDIKKINFDISELIQQLKDFPAIRKGFDGFLLTFANVLYGIFENLEEYNSNKIVLNKNDKEVFINKLNNLKSQMNELDGYINDIEYDSKNLDRLINSLDIIDEELEIIFKNK